MKQVNWNAHGLQDQKNVHSAVDGGDNDDGDDDHFDIVYIETNNKNHKKNSDKIQMSLLLLYWNTSNKLWKIQLSIYLTNEMSKWET